jgi:hypothetical protein
MRATAFSQGSCPIDSRKRSPADTLNDWAVAMPLWSAVACDRFPTPGPAPARGTGRQAGPCKSCGRPQHSKGASRRSGDPFDHSIARYQTCAMDSSAPRPARIAFGCTYPWRFLVLFPRHRFADNAMPCTECILYWAGVVGQGRIAPANHGHRAKATRRSVCTSTCTSTAGRQGDRKLILVRQAAPPALIWWRRPRPSCRPAATP